MNKNLENNSFYASILKWDEENPGKELREKYIYDITLEGTPPQGMTMESYQKMKIVEGEILLRLECAVNGKVSPSSLEGIEIAKKHKQWLAYLYEDYSPLAHLSLTNQYLNIDTFKNYYDALAPGSTEFLRNSVIAYTLMLQAEWENSKTILNNP